VVFGARDKRLGALGSTYDILAGNPINRKVEVVEGVLADDCLEMLKAFFRELRTRDKAPKAPPADSLEGPFDPEN
jgi:tRNA(adenine34) deaminase